MTEPDLQIWELAASGEIGDVVLWEDGYQVIGAARDSLCALEEVGKDKVDWNRLLDGLPDLQVLKRLEFPPLYVETSFEEIDGFLTLVEDPEHDEVPGMSFNQIRIYVDRKKGAEVLRQFQVLRNRLNEYL